MPRSHSPRFRCKVLDLVASRRPIKQVTGMFGIGDHPIYWAPPARIRGAHLGFTERNWIGRAVVGVAELS